MVVLIYLLLFSVLSFFVPSKARKGFIIFMVLLLPILYFWFAPPENSDLNRYNIILNSLRNLKFVDIFNGNAVSKSVYIQIYLGDSTPLSMVYFWLISKLFPNVFLPYITGVIIYGFIFGWIAEEFKNKEMNFWKFGIATLFFLMAFDYRSITGVRNEIAFIVLAYVLYKDLTGKYNTLFSFAIYVALIFFHPAVAIVLIVRLLFCLSGVLKPKIIGIICLVSPLFLNIISNILQQFANIGIFNTILSKLTTYSQSSAYNYRMVVGSMIMILFMSILVVFLKRSGYLNGITRYTFFFECILALSFGAIFQDVTFNRMELLVVFMSVPFICSFLNNIMGNSLTVFYSVSDNDGRIGETILVAIGFYLVIFFEVAYHLIYFYMDMMNYFNF